MAASLRGWTFFALLVLLALPTDVDAQSAPREGFFIGLGLGGGSLGVEDADERESGLAGYFKLGAALNDKVLIGAETSGWTKEEGGLTLTQATLSAVVYLYPNPTSGFFLRGGVGVTNLEVDLGLFGSADDNGAAFTAGAGFDIPVSGRFAITPFGNFTWSTFDEGSTTLFSAGLGFNWY